MGTRTIYVGPFSSDQLETFLRELQIKNIPYEVHRPHTDWVTLAKSDLVKVSARLVQFGIVVESLLQEPEQDPSRVSSLERQKKKDVFNQAKSEKRKFDQKLLVWILLLGLLCLGVIVVVIKT